MNVTEYGLRLKEVSQAYADAETMKREASMSFLHAERLAAEARGHRYSIVRTINAAAGDGLRDGYEAEVSQELAHRLGEAHDVNRPRIPWSAFTRTAIVGTAAQGGYLVSDPTTPAVAALTPYSTLIRLGAQVWGGLRSDVNVPRVSESGTAYTLAELGTATASQPALSQIACSPRRIGAYTEISRQLLRQAPGNAEAMVGAHLLGLAGSLIDSLGYNGTGTDEPLGILETAGVSIASGTSFDNTALQARLKTVLNSNVADINVRAVASPSVRELLSKKASNGTGSRYLWGGNDLGGIPAFTSFSVPSSTLVIGDFSTLVLLLWGDGLQVEVNPYANFQAGIVGFRVLPQFDLAVTQPGAFTVSTAVS